MSDTSGSMIASAFPTAGQCNCSWRNARRGAGESEPHAANHIDDQLSSPHYDGEAWLLLSQ